MAEADLRRAVQELREQSELMEATFNGISDGLVVVNTEGELLNANPAGRQIASFETMAPEQARLVRKWATCYYPDRETLIPPEDLPLNRAIFQGDTVMDRTMFVRTQSKPDGFFVRVSVQPLADAEGGIRGAVSIFRDVTDQRTSTWRRRSRRRPGCCAIRSTRGVSPCRSTVATRRRKSGSRRAGSTR